MAEKILLNYAINDPIELNLSYMPFVNDGGIFVPTFDSYNLGDLVELHLQLPTKKDPLKIQGKIVWITPKNALQHVLAGVGVQFMGPEAFEYRGQIESLLDKSMAIGGYTYGITEEGKREK